MSKVPDERPLPMGFKSWTEYHAEIEAMKRKERRIALLYGTAFALVLLLFVILALSKY